MKYLMVFVLCLAMLGCATKTALTDKNGEIVRDSKGDPIMITVPPSAEQIQSALQIAETIKASLLNTWQIIEAQKESKDNAEYQKAKQKTEDQLNRINAIIAAVKAGTTKPEAAKTELLTVK